MKTRAIEIPLFIPTASCASTDSIRTMRVTLPAEPWGDNPPKTEEPERFAPPIRAKPQHPRRGLTPAFHRVTGDRDKFQYMG